MRYFDKTAHMLPVLSGNAKY